MKISVIITTYNSENWLKKVLLGYLYQTEKDIEIIIADDVSTQKTKTCTDSILGKFKYPIVHIWH